MTDHEPNTENAPNVLITGATGGLGKALALACAERGARVILLDRNKRLLERLCDQVEALGAPAPGYADLDLSAVGPEQLKELVEGLTAAYGPLNGLVHAAVRFDGLRPLDQIAPEDWLLDLQVNLNVVWLLTLACLPSLKSAAGTVIFLVDGDAEGKAYWGSYGAAKAALGSLASTLAEELGHSGCRSLAIDPGPMRTDLRASAYLGENPGSIPLPSEAAERLAEVLLGAATDA